MITKPETDLTDKMKSRATSHSQTHIADACFDYLLAVPEELERFMRLCGYDGDRLRASLGTEALSRGLVDYFVTNEALMLAMCANSGLQPSEVMSAWHRQNPNE